jgi:hypothetical protein
MANKILALLCLCLTGCGSTLSLSGYGLTGTVVLPASSVPQTVQIPAQTIVVPASTAPVAVPLVKPAIVAATGKAL